MQEKNNIEKNKDDNLYQIIGKRWFDRKCGNTYHSVKVFVNNHFIGENPYTYGYDDQYIQTAFDILQEHGYFKGKSYYDFLDAKRYDKERFLISVSDVSRKKDL